MLEFLVGLSVFALLLVMMSVKIVRQGYRYTIERFGRFVRVAEPGFNGVTPGSGVMVIAPVSVCHHVSTIGQRFLPMSV